jgi:hypothetical protein
MAHGEKGVEQSLCNSALGLGETCSRLIRSDGLRNEVAHGHFDDLTRERTPIMIDGINLFISKHTDA